MVPALIFFKTMTYPGGRRFGSAEIRVKEEESLKAPEAGRYSFHQRVRSRWGRYMNADGGPVISEVGPRDAWDILSEDEQSVLVDVRSAPEWGFTGGPDLSGLGKDAVRVEWKTWPGMSPNPAFVGALMEAMPGLPSRLLFICRSGARSMQAAQAVAEALSAKGTPVQCLNVAEGFEGDLDAERHRGGLNGWKARGLAWRQT